MAWACKRSGCICAPSLLLLPIARHGPLQAMGTLSLLLLLLLLAAFAVLWWLWRRYAALRLIQSRAGDELKKLQDGQALVIHTTKLASLGQMVAGVAHEINTPLGFVKSNVEVVRDMLTEHRELQSKISKGVDALAQADLTQTSNQEAAKRALSRIRTALDHSSVLDEAHELLQDSSDGLQQMGNLVKNLKGFARVDRDGMDLFDVNESIDSALTITAHELRDRIEVVKELGQVPKVRGVPSQINQVFLNLITNAAQAMGDHGKLLIRTSRNGDMVETKVTDDGPGIPDQVLPKIFDPFFTTKPIGEGTGLGLSIVHKIVSAHGGNVSVDTAIGQGTTFTVSLPVDHGKAVAA
jgi:two-component system, NtrC family, sensor kinase